MYFNGNFSRAHKSKRSKLPKAKHSAQYYDVFDVIEMMQFHNIARIYLKSIFRRIRAEEYYQTKLECFCKQARFDAIPVLNVFQFSMLVL